MPFNITLSFLKDQDQDAFVERVVPKLRAHIVDPIPDEEADAQGFHRIGLAVTSQSAAKDICRHAASFLAHAKNARVVFSWQGPDREIHFGEVVAGEGKEADLLATRLGATAKAVLDTEKPAEA